MTEKYSEITSGYKLQQNVSLTNSLDWKDLKNRLLQVIQEKNWASDYY